MHTGWMSRQEEIHIRKIGKAIAEQIKDNNVVKGASMIYEKYMNTLDITSHQWKEVDEILALLK